MVWKGLDHGQAIHSHARGQLAPSTPASARLELLHFAFALTRAEHLHRTALG